MEIRLSKTVVVGALALSAAGLMVITQRSREHNGETPGQGPESRASSTPVEKVVTANSYAAEMSFKEKVNFPKTGIAFRGTVSDVLPARHVAIPDSRMEYVHARRRRYPRCISARGHSVAR